MAEIKFKLSDVEVEEGHGFQLEVDHMDELMAKSFEELTLAEKMAVVVLAKFRDVVENELKQDTIEPMNPENTTSKDHVVH